MKRFLGSIAWLILSVHAGTVYGQGCQGAGGAVQSNPSSVSFGQVAVGSTASKTLTIQNVSARQEFLLVNSIVPDDDQFSVKPQVKLPFCVPPASSFEVQVLFTPKQNGNIDSQLRVNSSSQTSPDSIPVSGVGTGGTVVIRFSPPSLDFGDVKVGKQSSKTFMMLNEGNVSAKIDRVSSDNTAFTVPTSFPETIPPGGQIQVKVNFLPKTQGPINGTLSVESGDTTLATMAVRGSGRVETPDISVSSLHIDFGTFDVGTFKDKILGISNKGKGTLQVTETPGSQVLVTPSGPLTIAPGKSVQLKVRLIADSAGAISKTLKLTSNDPDEEQVNVVLSAVGTKGELGLLDITQKSRIGNNTSDTTGIQWTDYNGDGKEDVFLTGHNRNFLFKNVGRNQFADVTNQARLGNAGMDTRGASWADVDNDGDLDVFLANFKGPASIMKNNHGVFAKQGGALGMFAAENTSASEGGIWLDFNNDGRLDLFVVKDGRANQLFKQTGLFRFADIASTAGIALKTSGRSAVAADFNDDGYPDIYIANENHPNRLYINRKNETFSDMTQSAGVGFNGASKQVTAADYDGDGDLDIFVANSDGTSVLYRNNGNLKFQNVTASAGLAGPKNTTSATFADFDNDGDQDLLIVQAPGENIVYRNVGRGRFVRSNIDISRTTDPSSSGAGDSNGDGTTDVVVGGGDGSSDSMYDNSGGAGDNWLVLVLQGTASNRSAIGAKVVVRVGALIQAKVVSAGNGQSQDSLPLEFGLGSVTSASVIIAWPSGKVQSLDNIAANQKLKITEPAD